MKLVGRATAGRSTAIITIERPAEVGGPFKLKLQALPTGVPETIMNHRLPLPNPPLEYVTKAGKVQKEEDGAYARRPNFLDMKYRERVKKIQQLQRVALVYESLKAEVNGDEATKITWETKEPSEDKAPLWEAFYGSLLAEMQSADFTTGDLNLLDKASAALSTVSEQSIEEAMNRFLPRPKAPVATETPKDESTDSGS